MPKNFLIGIFVGVVIGGGMSLLFNKEPVTGPMDSGLANEEEAASNPVVPGAVPLPAEENRPLVDASVPSLEPEREAVAQKVVVDREAPVYAEVPDSWISGMVIDENGQGLADVVVRAQMLPPEGKEHSMRGKDFAPFRAACRTAANGRFLLRGLLAGSQYKLGVRSQEPMRMNLSGNSENMNFEAVAPQEDLRLSLTESGLLLRFHLPAGMDELLNEKGEIPLEIRFERENGGSSSSSGTFPLEFKVGLAAEEKANLSIRGDGFRDVVYKDLVLEKNEGMRIMDIEFQAALGESMVVLQITDDLGQPVSVANIRSTQREYDRDLYRESHSFFHRGPSHGDRGRFTLDDLPLGEQVLRVDPVAGSGLVPALVELTVPEVGEVFRQVTLQRGGRLSLQLSRDHPEIQLGAALLRVEGEWRNSPLRLSSLGGGNRANVRKLQPGSSYELNLSLPPGQYGIRVMPRDGKPIEREFTIVAGQVASVMIDKS